MAQQGSGSPTMRGWGGTRRCRRSCGGGRSANAHPLPPPPPPSHDMAVVSAPPCSLWGGGTCHEQVCRSGLLRRWGWQWHPRSCKGRRHPAVHTISGSISEPISGSTSMPVDWIFPVASTGLSLCSTMGAFQCPSTRPSQCPPTGSSSSLTTGASYCPISQSILEHGDTRMLMVVLG